MDPISTGVFPTAGSTLPNTAETDPCFLALAGRQASQQSYDSQDEFIASHLENGEDSGKVAAHIAAILGRNTSTDSSQTPAYSTSTGKENVDENAPSGATQTI